MKLVKLELETLKNCDFSALYKIYIRGKKGKKISIRRLNNTDERGLMYIGHTTNLKTRLRNFLGGYNHSAGQRYFKLKKSSSFRKKFPSHELYVSYKKMSKKTAKKKEQMELQKYFSTFGEVPPLNNNLPGN